MLKYLTHKLKTQSINEENSIEKVTKSLNYNNNNKETTKIATKLGHKMSGAWSGQ